MQGLARGRQHGGGRGASCVSSSTISPCLDTPADRAVYSRSFSDGVQHLASQSAIAAECREPCRARLTCVWVILTAGALQISGWVVRMMVAWRFVIGTGLGSLYCLCLIASPALWTPRSLPLICSRSTFWRRHCVASRHSFLSPVTVHIHSQLKWKPLAIIYAWISITTSDLEPDTDSLPPTPTQYIPTRHPPTHGRG